MRADLLGSLAALLWSSLLMSDAPSGTDTSVSRVGEETGTAPRDHAVSQPMTRPDRRAYLPGIPHCRGCPSAGSARCTGIRPVP